jgi:hypothetical protein
VAAASTQEAAVISLTISIHNESSAVFSKDYLLVRGPSLKACEEEVTKEKTTMRKTTDSTTEEDIREISPEHPSRKTGSEDGHPPASPHTHETSARYFEDAIKSHPESLRDRWIAGESVREIAQGTGRDMKTIYDMLRDMQKDINEADGK